MQDSEAFRAKIKEALKLAKENGHTQAQVGEKAGVSPQAVGQWGRTGRISFKSLAVLARLSGKQMEWFGGTAAIQNQEQPTEVTDEQLRAEFSERLKTALQESGLSQRGAAVRLHEVTGKSANAATKWLKAESMPTPSNLRNICTWLNIREEWLAYGRGPMRSVEHLELHPSMETSYSRVNKARPASPRSASPRAWQAIEHMATAADAGYLTEDDLLLLEQIAKRIATQHEHLTDHNYNHSHERLKATLGNHDSSTKGDRS